jgi:hypothetical protein
MMNGTYIERDVFVITCFNLNLDAALKEINMYRQSEDKESLNNMEVLSITVVMKKKKK